MWGSITWPCHDRLRTLSVEKASAFSSSRSVPTSLNCPSPSGWADIGVKDNDRLIASLKKMRDLGSTLIVVEHDEDTMRQTTWSMSAQVPGTKAGGSQQQIHHRSVLVRQAQDSSFQQTWSGNGHYIETTGPVRITYKTSQHFHSWANLSQSLGFPVLENRRWSMAHLEKSHRSSSTAIQEKPGEIQDDSGGWAYPIAWSTLTKARLARTPRSKSSDLYGVFDDIRDLFCSDQWSQNSEYKKAALVSMPRAGVVKPAQEMGSSRLKCTSCGCLCSLWGLPWTSLQCETLSPLQGKKYSRSAGYDLVNKAVEFFKHISKVNANETIKMWAWAM